MSAVRFDFAFAAAYRGPALLLGITPRTAYVEVDAAGAAARELRVRFGLWSMRTPVANVTGLGRTGGYRWLKTVGPPHLSFTDRGVTFATNGTDGVCVSFREPVKVLDPTGRLLRHPGATLTVADPEGLTAALRV